MYSLNYLKELIGPLNFKGLEKIMKKDSSTFKCDEATYLKENYVAYLTCASTWLALIPTRPLAVRLFNLLENEGLTRMINYAKEADSAILRGENIASNNPFADFVPMLVRAFMHEIGDRDIIAIKDLCSNPRLFKRVHQVLVYASRFSAPYMPFLDKKTFDAFKEEQRRLSSHDRAKTSSRRDPRVMDSYSYWADKVRVKINEILPWDKICDRIEAMMADPSFNLSPGSCYITGPRVGDKILYLAGNHPELFMPIFSDSALRACEEVPYVKGRAQGHIVPKSSSIKRFIAAEEVYRQLICLGVFKILDDYLPNIGINLHDQEDQRALCLHAAATLEYATTDVTSASDGITKVLFEDLFPARFVKLMNEYLPSSVQVTVEGKEYILDLASRMTMGNAITFPCECIVFYASDAAVIETYELYTGEHLSSWIANYEHGMWLKIPGVYGDDQIHHSVVSETVYECLESLGFRVNRDKSYSGSNPFREACGVELIGNWDITPVRYPRKTIHGTITPNSLAIASTTKRDSRTGEYYDSISTLVSLQKELIENDLHEAADVVTAIVCCAVPNMTFSQIGSDCTDLWGNVVKTKGLGERQYQLLSPYATTFDGKPKLMVICETTRTLDAIKAKYERQFGHQPDYLVIEEKEYPELFYDLKSQGCDIHTHDMEVRVPHRIQMLDGLHKDEVEVKHFTTRSVKILIRKVVPAMYNTVPYEFDMHLTPVTEYELSQEEVRQHRLNSIENAVLEQWLYTDFLRNGPSYEHTADTLEGEIERMAGITKPRVPGHSTMIQDSFYKYLFGRPVINWKEKADR